MRSIFLKIIICASLTVSLFLLSACFFNVGRISNDVDINENSHVMPAFDEIVLDSVDFKEDFLSFVADHDRDVFIHNNGDIIIANNLFVTKGDSQLVGLYIPKDNPESRMAIYSNETPVSMNELYDELEELYFADDDD